MCCTAPAPWPATTLLPSGSEFYDDGNFQLTGTAGFNRTIYWGLSGTGTYTVNPDCTGSQIFGSGPTASHFDFVVTADGGKITYIQTDTGDVTATAVRLSSATD